MSLGVLGIMGAMLSITGIFGMAAYSVSKRLRELGIRVALGAQRKEVLQAALGRAVKLLTIGTAAGLGLGICDPRSRFHRLPSHTARSARPDLCSARDGPAWSVGYMDSGTARAVGGSADSFARRLTLPA